MDPLPVRQVASHLEPVKEAIPSYPVVSGLPRCMDEPHFYEEEPEDEQEQPPDEPAEIKFQAPPTETPSSAPYAAIGAERRFHGLDSSEAYVRGGCRDCRCLSVNQEWKEAFSVNLCVCIFTYAILAASILPASPAIPLESL